MHKTAIIVSVCFLLALAAAGVHAEVLGPCGTPDAQKSAPKAEGAGDQKGEPAGNAPVQRILMPGDQAPNFELTALVGSEAKTIKLSDYDGQWRIVCFYPADFTFV